MFSLSEEELKSLSNEVTSLQSQLQNIQHFASSVRARSKVSQPMQHDDQTAFEHNLNLILAIQNIPSFKETVIQYLLSNLFQSNISFSDVLHCSKSEHFSLCSKQVRQSKLDAAVLTQLAIKHHPAFPYSVGQVIVSYISIDHEVQTCRSSLRISDEVQLLFNKLRQQKEFSATLYSAFIRVDRKLFVPEHEKEDCNSHDRPINLNYGVSLSAPHIHVHALKQFEHLLHFNNDGESAVKFLDVGCGTGYVCTLMAVGFVLNNTNSCFFKAHGCVYNENLLEQAMHSRSKLGLASFLSYKQASMDMSDIGWKEEGPFDGIYCGAAIKECDAVLLREQLKVGGHLMCVVEHRDSAARQVMKLIKRIDSGEVMCKSDGSDQSMHDREEQDEDNKEEEEEEKYCKRPERDGKEVVSPTPDMRRLSDRIGEELSKLSGELCGTNDEEEVNANHDLWKLILKLQNEIVLMGSDDEKAEVLEDASESVTKGLDADETKANKVKLNSRDCDFEETELFDVRFRTLRGRFPYVEDDQYASDSDDDDSD